MSTKNISQIEKISNTFSDYFVSKDKNTWINGRPVLKNGDVWCPICEIWHENNTFCQQ